MPRPSGRHIVGKAVLHWVDSNRPEVATEGTADRRELVVHVWYPAAKPGRNSAPHMPGVEHLKSSAAADSLQNLFGPSWPSIVSNELRTHVGERTRRCWITVADPHFFSRGGVPAVSYTTQ
ncbi:MAG TPA: hypothetical protein VES20_16890, partial [Bryobacteraceae bacterium]|nr:hypothetical protein [Bryobacteraceae bacterium]